MQKFRLAAAQSISRRGDIKENTQRHLRLIELAAGHNVQCVLFPELSLTGYELDLAESLAFTANDERLNYFKEYSEKYKITIIAGAPYRSRTGLHIGAFIIDPERRVSVYLKRFLHTGEEKFFLPGNINSILVFEDEKLAVAICADISNPRHAFEASQSACTIYGVGALISRSGYETDSSLLQGYAQKHSLLVMLANHGGPSGGYDSSGRSAVWSPTGNLLAELEVSGEGLIIAEKDNNRWIGKAVRFNEKN
jgi:predicted amidohydrolase